MLLRKTSKVDGSRVLRVLIATSLAIMIPGQTAAQTIYDLPGVTVTWPGGWGEQGGGSGGGWGGSYTDYEPKYDSGEALCADLESTKPADCDVWNPPPMDENGCGSGATASIVPDVLIVDGVPVDRFGRIFEIACNIHDQCYGTFNADKGQCDANLGHDMVAEAKRQIPSDQWAYYERHVNFQAAAYSLFLSQEPGNTLSKSAFVKAQSEGSCRAHSGLLREYNCVW